MAGGHNFIWSALPIFKLRLSLVGITQSPIPVGAEGINPLDLALALSWPE